MLCGEERENLEHFIVHCPKLNSERIKILKLPRPMEENLKMVIGQVLFDESNREKIVT